VPVEGEHKRPEIRERTKTAGSYRIVPIPGFILRALIRHQERQIQERSFVSARWQGDEWDLIFATPTGRPLYDSTVIHQLQRMLEAVDLPKMRLYDLRHGAASFNVPIQVAMAILGHRQASTLLNVYAHASDRDRKAAMDLMGKMLDRTQPTSDTAVDSSPNALGTPNKTHA
jgi:integrase